MTDDREPSDVSDAAASPTIQRGGVRFLERGWLVVTIAIVLALLAGHAVLMHAAQRGTPEDASRWFDGLSAAYSGLAVALAVFAALVGIQAYRVARSAFRIDREQYEAWLRDQTRRPRINLSFEIVDGDRVEMPTRLDGSSVQIADSVFRLRVVVENLGDGLLRAGIVNISVLANCDIEVLDPPEKGHYLVALPLDNERVRSAGAIEAVKETVAREDYAPAGIYRYHVRVATPQPGSWPVLAEVSGDPPPTSEEVRLRRLEVLTD